MSVLSGVEALMDRFGGGKQKQYTPKENPAFGIQPSYDGKTGKSNGYVDAQGVPVTDQAKIDAYQTAVKGGYADKPYIPFTAKQAKYSPEAANYVAQQNSAGVREQYQHAIAQGITAGDYSKIRPVLTSQLSGMLPQQAAIMSGGNLTAQNLEGVNTANARQLYGLPVATAEQQLSGEQAQNQLNQNTRVRALNAAYLGTPALQSRAENVNAGNELMSGMYQRPNIQPAATLTGTTIGNEQQQAEALRQRLPLLAGSAYDEALKQKALSDVEAGNIPTLQNTLQNQIRTGARESFYPAPMANPIAVSSTGQLQRNPYYASMMQTMYPKLGTSSSLGSNPIPIGNGLHILPDNASIPQPSTQTNTTAIPQRQVRTPIVSPTIIPPQANVLAPQYYDPNVRNAAYTNYNTVNGQFYPPGTGPSRTNITLVDPNQRAPISDLWQELLRAGTTGAQ